MFSGVVISGAGVGSVSVVSGCVESGAGAAGSDAVVSLSAGELPGVVGAVGTVGAADGSSVTLVWALPGCEPVAVITSPL